VPVDAWQLRSSDVPFGTLSIWAHMDGDHYLSVAQGGYSDGSPVFISLYPLLVRVVAFLFGGPISQGVLSVYGVFVSLTAFCLALYFIYRIVEEGWGTRTARGTVLTLAFFPTSFFFNAVYTESLFLALSAGSVWALRVRENLFLACLLACFATATRNLGVFLLIPLIWEWWHDRHRFSWRAVYLALTPAGLAAYMAHLWWSFGDPLLFQAIQADWGRAPICLRTPRPRLSGWLTRMRDCCSTRPPTNPSVSTGWL
jgi:Gpi18-like mannosyltransferase